jgi:hypothetical protein
MAGKSRMRPSFKKHTRRYKEVVAPAKLLEGQKNLTKNAATLTVTVSSEAMSFGATLSGVR